MPFTPEHVQSWYLTMQSERSASPPRTDMEYFSVSDEEFAPLNSMYGQLSRHRRNVQGVQTLFAQVDARAGEVMIAMTPAAGRGGSQPRADGMPGGAAGDY